MCAGFKKKRGVEGERSPPRREGWGGGRSPPPFANVLASRQAKSFEKKVVQY